MKLSTLTLAAAVAAACAGMAFAPAANAADGTITITGKVMNQTCSVSAGPGNGTPVVLAPVAASDLQTAGDTANDTDFDVTLSGCPTNPGVQVAASFSGSNIDTANGGRLSNANGTAANVDVELSNQGSATALNLASDESALQTIDASGNATLPFTARYYSLGNATAGTVDTSVDFTVVYQ